MEENLPPSTQNINIDWRIPEGEEFELNLMLNYLEHSRNNMILNDIVLFAQNYNNEYNGILLISILITTAD